VTEIERRREDSPGRQEVISAESENVNKGMVPDLEIGIK
jgi:hypothetical protein